MSADSLTRTDTRLEVGHRAGAPTRPLAGVGLGLLLVLFLLSGLSGLIYQVLWQRMLALIFGVSAYATATVLAAFMAGLAIGGVLAGRVADRVRSPLLLYGLVEVLIGLTGALTPIAFGALQDVYPALHGVLGGSAVTPLVRFAIVFGALLVPTALMGASFPLIVKAALAGRDDRGVAIGLLYSINTLGACAGAILAGFFLIGQLGVTTSIACSAGLNVAAGLAAIGIGYRMTGGGGPALGARQLDAFDELAHHQPPTCHAEQSEASGSQQQMLRFAQRDHQGTTPRKHRAADALPTPARLARLLPWLLAVSGFCSLAYEVVWTRLLVLFLDSTTYAFTVMLAAFLLGIAAGSALVSPFLRRARNGPLAFAALQALVAISSLLSLQFVAAMEPGLSGLGGASIGALALIAGVALFPPALFLGMSFPLAVTLYTTGLDPDTGPADAPLGRRLGSLYAANVGGAIFGALAAGFLLIPLLGTLGTLLLLAGLNAVSAALILGADTFSSRRSRFAIGAASFAALGVLSLLAPLAYQGIFVGRFRGETVVWAEEGIETTVTITGGEQLSMYLNRHHQANDADWMVFFHRMLGHLPMLVHPDPREVLIVGLGGGATAGATTRYQDARVTVVELSRSVVRGAEWFRDVNYAATEQPNVQILVDDGRNHLLVSGRRYDVIGADAIWPTLAGSTNLYSLEYYRLARAALNEGGVMVQWVNRDLPAAQHKLLMRTFLAAFPQVSLWFDGSLLIGSERPIDPRPGLDRKFAWPLSKAALQQVNLRSPEDVIRLYVADRAEVEAYAGEGPIITDDRPRLEYFLGLSSDTGPGPRRAP